MNSWRISIDKKAVLIITAVISISISILLIFWASNDVKNIPKEDNEKEFSEFPKKIKGIIKRENFKKIKIPENSTLYYFPDKCPDYTEDTFIKTKVDGFDKYFLPEEHTMILIGEHSWTNTPNFQMWTSRNYY